jgi:hypothetical protein
MEILRKLNNFLTNLFKKLREDLRHIKSIEEARGRWW